MTTNQKLTSLADLRNLSLKIEGAKTTVVKKKHTYQRAEPVYLRKLDDKLKSKAAVGRAVGVTGMTVSRALRGLDAPKYLETAAMGVWLRDHEPKPKAEVSGGLPANERIVMLRLDAELWSVLKPQLDQAGIINRVMN